MGARLDNYDVGYNKMGTMVTCVQERQTVKCTISNGNNRRTEVTSKKQ